MIVQKLFLDGAVESFNVGIHLGCLGVSVIVGDLQFEQFNGEVFFPLAAVVGQDKGDRIRKQETERLEEISRGPGSMRARGPGKSETTKQIFTSDDIAA